MIAGGGDNFRLKRNHLIDVRMRIASNLDATRIATATGLLSTTTRRTTDTTTSNILTILCIRSIGCGVRGGSSRTKISQLSLLKTIRLLGTIDYDQQIRANLAKNMKFNVSSLIQDHIPMK